MAATIKDIAKRLNLSVSTVSYALNDGPKPVSLRVREAVLEAAREMDYRPNRLAKTLVTRRTHCIGLVPPKLHRDMMLSPFVQLVINGIVNVGEELHQDILLFTGSDRNTADAVVNDLLDRRIDGVVFVAPHTENKVLDFLEERGFPFAVVASGRPMRGLGFDIDNECGATLALEHLYELGHRRIAHIAGVEWHADARVRLDVYRRFLAERGITVPRQYVAYSDYLYRGGYEAAKRLLSQDPRPTAIFAANDNTALGAIDFAKEIGLTVPEDLSIVGFDDTEAGARAQPALTTVRQPVEEMGARAMRAVVARVEGRPVDGHLFPTALIVRHSTNRPKEDSFIHA